MRRRFLDNKEKTVVSVLGIYSSFEALRSGSQALHQLGFGNRDLSVLFFEDALISPDGGRDSDTSFSSQCYSSRALIGGTLEDLSYLDVRQQGTITAAIMSLGVPEYEAEEYEIGICNGQLLLCVRSASPAFGDVAMQMLLHTGAKCILAVPQSRSFIDIQVDRAWSEFPSCIDARLVC